jgi:hypothetical protein
MRTMTDTQSRSSPTKELPASPQRILAAISEVARYGLLGSEQVARLDGGSRQTVTRILQYCVEQKLLRRLDRAPKVFLGSFFDARPRVYAVTAKGLRFLEDAGISLNVTPRRSAVLLAHDLEVANVCFEFRGAVARSGKLALIDEPELLDWLPPTSRERSRPVQLHATARPRDFQHLGDLVKEPMALVTEPDRVLALATADRRVAAFAIELDTGHENLHARRLAGKATWLRKSVSYTAAYLQGAHVAQWGEWCKSFRVATITTSDTRIQNMIEIQQHVTRGMSGLFVYSTPERLKTFGALGRAWVNAKHPNGFSLIEE